MSSLASEHVPLSGIFNLENNQYFQVAKSEDEGGFIMPC